MRGPAPSATAAHPAGALAGFITRNSPRGPVAKTITCRTCGRDFERFYRAGRHAYCKGCTARADKKAARMPRVDCRECGKPFLTRTRTVRYCSDACRASASRRASIETQRRRMADPKKRAMRLASIRAWAAARRAGARGDKPPPPPPRASRGAGIPRSSAKAAKPRACALCGRDIEPRGRGMRPVHCRRCTARADREYGRVVTMGCKECGKKFVMSKRAVRYCSKACRADGRRRVARESARRTRADPEIRALTAARNRASLAARRGGKKARGARRRA